MTKIKTFFIAILFVIGSIFAAPPAHAKGCSDVEFIFARGSGENLGDVSAKAWEKSIRESIAGMGLSYSFYELGSDEASEYSYPAVAVSDSLGGAATLVGAYIGRGTWFKFGQSVREGITELKSHTRAVSSACPNTKFVLGGYSQGAVVMMEALDVLDSSKILYVATFGDPKLYLPEGNHFTLGLIPRIPKACSGVASEYREYVPDCWAFEGVLGGLTPYYSKNYKGKVGTWCNDKDIMCSSGASIDDHTRYISKDLYADAARVIAGKLYALSKRPSSLRLSHLGDEVALVIDATGSMGDFLKLNRAKLQTLGEKIIASGGEVAVVTYRDLHQSEDPWVQTDFTRDKEKLREALGQFTTFGGGYWHEESALSGLDTALNDLTWQTGATKSIFLLSDTNYWDPDLRNLTTSKIVNRSLEIDPVNIYVATPAEFQSDYEELVASTSGRIFDLDGDYFDEIADLLLGRPEARLAASEYSGYVGDEFVFDASASYALDGSDLTYEWNIDGEYRPGPAVMKATYASPFSGYVEVRVKDAAGRVATMSAKVSVYAEDYSPSLPEITSLNYRLLPIATESSTTSSRIATEPGSAESSLTSAEIDFTATTSKVFLVIDGAPLGIISAPGGSGSFTLTDLSGVAELTLTPISDDKKGIPRTLTILAPEASEAPETPEVPEAPQNPSTPETSPSPSTPSASASPSTPSPLEPPEPLGIPEAPASGTARPISSLDANDPRIRTYIRLASAHYDHAAPLAPPPRLPREFCSKLCGGPPPSISPEHARDTYIFS